MNPPDLHQKTEYTKLPLRIDKKWVERLTEKGKRLVMTRNATVLLCIKIGAPILDHYISMMEKIVSDQCSSLEKFAGALPTNSAFLPLPALAAGALPMAHGKRSRPDRAATSSGKASSAKRSATEKPCNRKKGC